MATKAQYFVYLDMIAHYYYQKKNSKYPFDWDALFESLEEIKKENFPETIELPRDHSLEPVFTLLKDCIIEHQDELEQHPQPLAALEGIFWVAHQPVDSALQQFRKEARAEADRTIGPLVQLGFIVLEGKKGGETVRFSDFAINLLGLEKETIYQRDPESLMDEYVAKLFEVAQEEGIEVPDGGEVSDEEIGEVVNKVKEKRPKLMAETWASKNRGMNK